MSGGPGSLRGLLGEPGPHLLDGIDLPAVNVGPPFYRFGDRPMPRSDGMIVAPHRIVDPHLERVVYGPGDLMTPEDARHYGVLPAGDEATATVTETPQRGGRRGKRRPTEDRAVDGPSEDRSD
jgi:hypothetical protein